MQPAYTRGHFQHPLSLCLHTHARLDVVERTVEEEVSLPTQKHEIRLCFLSFLSLVAAERNLQADEKEQNKALKFPAQIIFHWGQISTYTFVHTTCPMTMMAPPVLPTLTQMYTLVCLHTRPHVSACTPPVYMYVCTYVDACMCVDARM